MFTLQFKLFYLFNLCLCKLQLKQIKVSFQIRKFGKNFDQSGVKNSQK